jgi:hypothetical protein
MATSRIGRGRLDGATLRREAPDGVGASARSSTSAIQEPSRAQSGHVPGFGLAKPHAWQR